MTQNEPVQEIKVTGNEAQINDGQSTLEPSNLPGFGSPKKIPDVVLRDWTKERTTVSDPDTQPIDAAEIAEEQREKLPKPTGYRILIIPQNLAPKSKGGIVIPQTSQDRENLASVVGYVVDIGPDAYKDQYKFPEGAWCAPGDYVIFGRYAGSRITMDAGHGDKLELRILNDDEIIAVTTHPKDYIGVI